MPLPVADAGTAGLIDMLMTEGSPIAERRKRCCHGCIPKFDLVLYNVGVQHCVAGRADMACAACDTALPASAVKRSPKLPAWLPAAGALQQQRPGSEIGPQLTLGLASADYAAGAAAAVAAAPA